MKIENETIEYSANALKEIESGLYRNKYLIYNRKSSDEPNSQKNSIKYQKAENMRFAMREQVSIANVSLEGFCVDGIISERHSGFKEDTQLIFGEGGTVQYRIERPKFYQLVDFLHKGYFKGVVVLCWDRASRNKGDNNVIEKLLRLGIDFRFTLATYDKTSSGALHMDIDGMFAQHHSRVTSEKVALAIRNQRDKGICTYKAPIGYLNSGSMEHKPFDPVRAPVVRQIFEKYAEGTWSITDVTEWANSQGLTMPPVRPRRTREEMLLEEVDDTAAEMQPICRPVRRGNIHKILTNPFYIGKIRGNDGELIQSRSHQPLVSEELFIAIQDLLRNRKVSIHYTNKLPSPYRGLIRCGGCNRVYTPYEQKGIMYYGSRCITGCANGRKNFNASFLELEVEKKLQHLHFMDKELEEITARAITGIAILEQKRHVEMEQDERRKRTIREEQNYLRTNKLSLLRTGVYSTEGYLEEETRLSKALIALQAKEQISDTSMQAVVETVYTLSELLKDLYLTYKKAKAPEKEQIIRMLFSELHLSENTLICKLPKGLEPFENRFDSFGALTVWLSELVRHHKDMQEIVKKVELFLRCP